MLNIHLRNDGASEWHLLLLFKLCVGFSCTIFFFYFKWCLKFKIWKVLIEQFWHQCAYGLVIWKILKIVNGILKRQKYILKALVFTLYHFPMLLHPLFLGQIAQITGKYRILWPHWDLTLLTYPAWREESHRRENNIKLLAKVRPKGRTVMPSEFVFLLLKDTHSPIHFSLPFSDDMRLHCYIKCLLSQCQQLAQSSSLPKRVSSREREREEASCVNNWKRNEPHFMAFTIWFQLILEREQWQMTWWWWLADDKVYGSAREARISTFLPSCLRPMACFLLSNSKTLERS